MDNYPYHASWAEPDANGVYHTYAVRYATPYAKPILYIDGLCVTDAEFAATYGHYLPGIAYPPIDANQRP